MTVLSGGGGRSGTGERSDGGLIERMEGRQSAWLSRRKRRKGRCAGVEEGAGTAWGERGCAGRTGCGCAGPGRGSGGEVRMRKPSVWRLVGVWSAAGFGRMWRRRRRRD